MNLINAACKFNSKVLHIKGKYRNILVHDSNNVIFTASSVNTLTKQYLNLYAQYLIPDILWILYRSNLSIFHYIPEELIQIIIDNVTHV